MITLLERHLLWRMLSATVGVLLVLAVLAWVGALLGALPDLGQGGFGLPQLLMYSLLQLPEDVIRVWLIGVVVGGVLGLAQLMASNELVAATTLGLSRPRMMRLAGWFGLCASLLWVALSEWVATPMNSAAEHYHEQALGQSERRAAQNGLWLRVDEHIVLLNGVDESGAFRAAMIFERRDGRVQRVLRAGGGQLTEHGAWTLRDSEVLLTGEAPQWQSLGDSTWQGRIDFALLRVLDQDPRLLSLRALHTRVQAARPLGVPTLELEQALWSRLWSPVATGLLLACCALSVLGLQRDGGGGRRVFLACLAAISYQVLERLLAQGGAILGLPTMLAGAVPMLLVLLIFAWLYRRQYKL